MHLTWEGAAVGVRQLWLVVVPHHRQPTRAAELLEDFRKICLLC